MNQREAAARVALTNFIPRLNYQGDGTGVPQLCCLQPVQNRETRAVEMLVMDAPTLEEATYFFLMPLENAPPNAFIGAANMRFYAEWN